MLPGPDDAFVPAWMAPYGGSLDSLGPRRSGLRFAPLAEGHHADVVEQDDTMRSDRIARTGVEVRLLSSAPLPS
jgi:hypothetical protein